MPELQQLHFPFTFRRAASSSREEDIIVKLKQTLDGNTYDLDPGHYPLASMAVDLLKKIAFTAQENARIIKKQESQIHEDLTKSHDELQTLYNDAIIANEEFKAKVEVKQRDVDKLEETLVTLNKLVNSNSDSTQLQVRKDEGSTSSIPSAYEMNASTPKPFDDDDDSEPNPPFSLTPTLADYKDIQLPNLQQSQMVTRSRTHNPPPPAPAARRTFNDGKTKAGH
jgi:hypothetical protein